MERENSVATTTHVPVEQATCSTALCSFPLFMTRPRLCCSLKKIKKRKENIGNQNRAPGFPPTQHMHVSLLLEIHYRWCFF